MAKMTRVLILADNLEFGKEVATRLGYNDVTLWNDYRQDRLSKVTLPSSEEETNSSGIDVDAMIEAKAMNTIIRYDLTTGNLPAVLLVVGSEEASPHFPGSFQPTGEKQGYLPGLIHFSFDQNWRAKDDQVILVRDRRYKTGITLDQYLACLDMDNE